MYYCVETGPQQSLLKWSSNTCMYTTNGEFSRVLNYFPLRLGFAKNSKYAFMGQGGGVVLCNFKSGCFGQCSDKGNSDNEWSL